ncbi:MAG TPA: hypothetical protein VGR72_13035 [Candidatus Acidoferrales bacterium]|nr:hypothetical protein [Candidatus Acidoferrales bacterium]
MTLLVFTALGGVIFVSLIWLLFAPNWSGPRAAVDSLEIEQLEPLHCRHFPQISMLLRLDDQAFVEQRAPASLARMWRQERRRILLKYLSGLTEDFARLEHLARLIASLSPEVSRKREWEWFRLGLQFRLMLRLLNVRIVLGSLSLPQFARLTDFVASQAADLESRMVQLAGVLPSRLRVNPSA